MDEKVPLIPRKIHYFWFSDEPMPALVVKCMDSWKVKLSNYELKKWDLSNVDLKHPFAQRALKDEKWAFLTDYCRLEVLSREGGIYLDTDVLVLQSFDPLLNNASFWGQAENGFIEPVVVGAVAHNHLVKECLAQYDDPDILKRDYLEIPRVIAPVFQKEGFDLKNQGIQIKQNNIVYPFDYFCPLPFEEADTKDILAFKTKNTFAIHLWNANWMDPFRFFWNNRRKAGWKAVFREIQKKPNQGYTFYKNVFYHLKCQLLGYPKK